MIGVASGTIVATRGALLEASIPTLCVGAGAHIVTGSGRVIPARVTAVAGQRVTLAPFAATDGIAVGDCVESDPGALALELGSACLGRAIDALGVPLDSGPPLCGSLRGRSADAPVPAQLPGDNYPDRSASIILAGGSGCSGIRSGLSHGEGMSSFPFVLL